MRISFCCILLILVAPIDSRLQAMESPRPSETRLPLAETLNKFRKTTVMAELGGAKYHVSVQPSRIGEWSAVLLAEGANVHEVETTLALKILTTWRPFHLRGEPYFALLTDVDGTPTLLLNSQRDERSSLRVPLPDLRQALFNAGVPTQSLGPQWRLIYETELWNTAQLQSLVFIEKTSDGLQFHIIPADSLEYERGYQFKLNKQEVIAKLEKPSTLVIQPVR